MGYLKDLGPLAIASRMKNITDNLMRDMADVYACSGIEFEPRWFTFVHLLHARGPLPVTRIARELGQTHPAVNQVANVLERRGLVISRRDSKDQRKRIIGLTPSGIQMADRLLPLWQAVSAAAGEFLGEACPDFLDDLEKMEMQLHRTPMKERILRKLSSPGNAVARIIPFSSEFAGRFRSLNEEWLQNYFSVEPEDRRLLDDPEGMVIGRGGTIVFAQVGDEIIGTGALLHLDREVCELTKMAVMPGFQGRSHGRSILRHLIGISRQKGYRKIILLTSEKLHKAVNLYRSEGFVDSAAASVLSHNYKRCSIQMELDLGNNNP